MFRAGFVQVRTTVVPSLRCIQVFDGNRDPDEGRLRISDFAARNEEAQDAEQAENRDLAIPLHRM